MAGRDPQTRRAPSRRSAPVRPGNRAAGAADAARGDDADGPAIALRRSSNRARSRATLASSRTAPRACFPSAAANPATTGYPLRFALSRCRLCASGMATLARVWRRRSWPSITAVPRRVARLSTCVLSQIARPVSDWILRLATPLQQEPREPFEALWSALLRALRKHPEATESGLISSSAIDWANHALNSPIGNLAQALMKDESLESSAGPFLPSWLSKVESLLGITGDAHRDALVIFSHQLVWIYGRAPDWAEAHLLSVLGHDREDERAFWSGFFWAAQIPGFELYARLKPFLLAMVSPERNRSSDVEKIAGMLLAGWGSFDTIQGGERCVSNDEVRQALRAGGDDFRVQVLWHLKTWSKEGGSADQALVLLRDVWPRERAVRTEETSAGLFDLAIDTDGDMFTLLVDAVTPLMTTLSSSTLGLVELMRGADEELVREPMALLKLLYAALAQSATDWPYHADSVIERLASNPATAHDPRMAELRRRLAAR
jgi:hypothetical protein